MKGLTTPSGAAEKAGFTIWKTEPTKMELRKGRYRHYKGKEYEVIGVAKHSETREDMVVYKALYGDGNLWARPLKMFMEKVKVNGIERPRFEYKES